VTLDFSAYDGITITNIETVPNHVITEHFGLVNGSNVRSKHVGVDFLASLKNIVGGELGGYTKLLEETREEAVRRMVEQAKMRGANAIVNARFSTSSVASGASELYVYGTAVRVKPREHNTRVTDNPQQPPHLQRHVTLVFLLQ
jgi:uncharacterized protein YbjQ (UPF0145 family)